ncbi:ABC transporter substrate-binding protein [Nonlabens spongiae]|uniref:ABC transporter substrate-binding protein n=1 Tax=Nonlabens spongiae TaxID=331648 RepID=A0A1W6MHP3_9FLAO|nr:ABC transporter substrate-binding protein [Nonlabens spongiae]ARN77113.1 ABC transporter substrate-binding protein [Nonlabens spongiae]
MQKHHYLKIIALFCILLSCKEASREETQAQKTEKEKTEHREIINIKYATGFQIEPIDEGYLLTITNPWPEADQDYHYLLTTSDEVQDQNAVKIQIPIKRFIATSTTHVPPLVLLGKEQTLKAFPSTDYISSPEVRKLIDEGEITDLGIDSSMDVEAILLAQPDLVMGYGVSNENAIYKKVQQAGVPLIYNGDWVEPHPLGKAEWIKVYGLLYDRYDEALKIFNQIERDYLNVKKQVRNLDQPTVIAGATWKDTWYLPYGDSWQGKILKDAGGDYIYADTSGTGSLAYNIEQVLADARTADFWIAPGQYTSYEKMRHDQNAYTLFKAFEERNVYTFAKNKGAKGGVTYYEEAAMRPDLVLKDLVKILHPEMELDHKLYFFSPLDK